MIKPVIRWNIDVLKSFPDSFYVVTQEDYDTLLAEYERLRAGSETIATIADTYIESLETEVARLRILVEG